MNESEALSEEVIKRKNLILRNLQEVLGEEKITKFLISGKSIRIYWGTATTGRPHVGYFVPMQKIADLLRAGLNVIILFADLHAFLDNLKSTFDVLENRVFYYEHVIKALLTALDVPIDKLSFIKGSSYQLSKEYTCSFYKLCSYVTQRDAIRAGAEVVKQVDNPLLSGLLYPLLQALDEQFLKVDGQIGGVDQRKIFILAEEQLPKLKFNKRFHLMNPMVPGLTGSKMSSSEENSKIDLIDSSAVVNSKIDSALCLRKAVLTQNEENGILSFYKFVVFPISQKGDENISIKLGAYSYTSYECVENDFESGKLSEEVLKSFLKKFLNQILDSVRQKSESEEIKKIISNAYPTIIANDCAKVNDFKLEIVDQVENETIEFGLKCLYPAQINQALKNKSFPICIVYRCSIKGYVNLSHFSALMQLKRLQKACNCQCTILISDLGAYLDNEKCSWDALESRSKYYEVTLKKLMELIFLKNVEIKHTSEFEYERDYILNMYKVVSKVTCNECALVPGNTLATRLCVILFLLDLCYSKNGPIDLLLIGNDYIPFVSLAQKISRLISLPHNLPSVLILPEIWGTDGLRMSSTKYDFILEPVFSTTKQLRQKIGKSFCMPGNLKNNVALSLAQSIIFPLLNIQEKSHLIIERSEENGGNLFIESYNELETIFQNQTLHPADLKFTITNNINLLFESIRECFSKEAELIKLIKSAFPTKKTKK